MDDRGRVVRERDVLPTSAVAGRAREFEEPKICRPVEVPMPVTKIKDYVVTSLHDYLGMGKERKLSCAAYAQP